MAWDALIAAGAALAGVAMSYLFTARSSRAERRSAAAARDYDEIRQAYLPLVGWAYECVLWAQSLDNAQPRLPPAGAAADEDTLPPHFAMVMLLANEPVVDVALNARRTVRSLAVVQQLHERAVLDGATPREVAAAHGMVHSQVALVMEKMTGLTQRLRTDLADLRDRTANPPSRRRE